jgi:hypothetical protein
MRMLHWETVNAVPDGLLARSVFAQVGAAADDSAAASADDAATPSLGEADLKELAALFAVGSAKRVAKRIKASVRLQGGSAPSGSAASGAGQGGTSSGSTGGIAAQVIDGKRANNVSICLAQYRKLQPPVLAPAPTAAAASSPLRFPYQLALVAALLRCDETVVSVDRLEPMVELLPTPSETKALAACPTPPMLPEPDLFLWRCSLVPRFPAKLRAVVALRGAADAAHTVTQRAATLTRACTTVTGSTALRSLVAVVLAVGNAMNQGTARGGAKGFRLESLLRLRSTKGSDGRTSLLDYVVTTLHKQNPEAPEALLADLALADKGRRVLLADLRSQVATITGSVKATELELNREQQDLKARLASTPDVGSAGTPVLAPGQPISPPPAQAPPAAGGGMAALLAGIRSAGTKRGALKGAAASPSASDKFPRHAPRLQDREEFARRVEAGLAAARLSEKQAQDALKEALAASASLAEFFAEDAATVTPDHVLTVLSNFASMFGASVSAAARRRRSAAAAV